MFEVSSPTALSQHSPETPLHRKREREKGSALVDETVSMLSKDKSIDKIQRLSKPKVTLQFSGLSANYMNYTALKVTE